MAFRGGSGEADRAWAIPERVPDPAFDPKTGLREIEAFRRDAGHLLDRARTSGEGCVLALFDVDGFRALNAAHGGVAGDAVLVALAAGLRETMRHGDLLARTGSDEVCALLVDTSFDGAIGAAQRLVDAVAESPVPGVGSVTVSAGLAEHVRHESVEQLLARAGTGVDAARRDGGGRLSVGCGDAAPDGLDSARADVVGALATTLLERDRYTGEHSEWVVGAAKAVAYALGLDARQIRDIGWAALLHDIGKVAIPDHILNKPGPLDAVEWRVMQEHPVIGARILGAIPGMTPIARIVRHEHESFDGSGYPDGLAGEDIPLGSRIILACDSYHAITTDRPYRPGRSHEEAVAELARCAGTQFDPRVAEALIGYLHRLRASGWLG